MNKLMKVGLLGVAVVLTGCQNDAKKAEVPVKLETEDQKVAYSMGVSMAKYLGASLEQQEELGVKLDSDLIVKGLTDGLKENSQLDDETLRTTLVDFEKKMTTLAQEAQQAELEKLKADGDAWLAEMAATEGVETTESGLMYKVITQGDGAKPTAEDKVTVHYRGTLPTGEEFDSSYARGETISFALNGVIKGWTEALQLMPVGSKYELYIPSDLAYGERGAGQMIGPNTPLKFEVELFAINQDETSEAEAN